MKTYISRTAALMALGVLALSACSGTTPGNQSVPSDQDGTPATSDGGDTPLPQLEEGDEVQGLPALEEAPAQKPLSGKEIGDLETQDGDEYVEGDGKITGQESYFGYKPSEVEVPESVKEAFPDRSDTVAEYSLAYILGSGISADLHGGEISEDTLRLTYRGMETYLSDELTEFLEENVNKYVAATNEEDMADPYLQLWGIAPLHPKYGGWNDPNTGKPAEVDHSRSWQLWVDSYQVIGVTQGEAEVDGVEIQFNRGVEIPLTNPDYDMRVYQGFNITMVPGEEDGEWRVDQFYYETHTVEEIDKLP